MCTVFTGSGKSVNVKRVFMDCYCFDRSKMVQPITLKKRHSLKGLTLFPVLRKMKDGGSVKEFARISSTKKTDSLTLRDIGKAINDITGEPMDELMELAGLLFLCF